ncbi:MAG TPA: ABC transporter substrate-binding protein [Alphaproteobacteria bacterium]
MRRRDFTKAVLGASSALACPALIRPAAAEVTAIRLGKQYGLPYLPLMVMERHKLVEKHAGQAGLASLAIEWATMGGPGALTDALLTRSFDFVVVAAPTLATLWDKTAGTAQEIKGVSAVQSMPYLLVTRNPDIRSIADFTDKDRIAVPTAKISSQAISLEIAAAKLWGFDQYERLDPLTVTLPHPDAVAALLSGKSEVNSHYAVAPFQFYELKSPALHGVLKSYDTFGGKHANGLLLASKRFSDENPKICAAVLKAQEEANALINADAHGAAEIYIAMSGDRTSSVDEIAKMVADPDVDYTTTPAKVMDFAGFMHKVGRIKRLPASWKDYFFPAVHDLKGS